MVHAAYKAHPCLPPHMENFWNLGPLRAYLLAIHIFGHKLTVSALRGVLHLTSYITRTARLSQRVRADGQLDLVHATPKPEQC